MNSLVQKHFTASGAGANDDPSDLDELAAAFVRNNEANTAALAEIRRDLQTVLTASRGAVARGIGPQPIGRNGTLALPSTIEPRSQPSRYGRPTASATVDVSTERRDTHHAALATFMRTGDHEALQVERAAGSLMVQDEPSGGFTVPDEISRDIVNLQRNISPMRRLARVVETTSSSYGQPVNKGGTNGGWVSETDPRPQTDVSKLGLLTVPSCELYAQPAATQKLLDDSFINIAEWIESEVVTTFAEIEGVAFISGDGIEKPLGLLGVPIVAERDAVRAWGKFEYIPTGVGAGFAAGANAVNCMIDLVYRLKAGYRKNAKWLMNSASAANISKLKDSTDQLIWRWNIVFEEPPLLLGYPVEIDENMPDIGDAGFAVAFGDFERGYLITDRFDVRLLRDPFSSKPYVLFYATKRVGGAPMDTNAIKFLKFAAS